MFQTDGTRIILHVCHCTSLSEKFYSPYLSFKKRKMVTQIFSKFARNKKLSIIYNLIWSAKSFNFFEMFTICSQFKRMILKNASI